MEKDLSSIDYNAHYDSLLVTKEDTGKIKASDFLHYFSELIIKYSNDIEKNY